MLLTDYVFFLAYHWGVKQKRRSPDSFAQRPIFGAIGFTFMSIVPIVHLLFDFDVFDALRGGAPSVKTGRYSAETIAVALPILVIAIIYGSIRLRKSKRVAALRAFSPPTITDLKLAPWFVLGSYLSAIIFAIMPLTGSFIGNILVLLAVMWANGYAHTRRRAG
ncbi:hypothetical protein [Lysobacter sp. A289]